MAEQTTVAAPSAAQESTAPVIEVERGPLVTWTPEQRTEFRTTGEMPAPPKKQEAAASSEKTETRPASEAGKTTQEKPGAKAEKPKPNLSAEERIAQLESTIEKIREGAGLKKTPKTDSSPVHVEPPKPQAQQPLPQQTTRPKPTAEDKTQDGKPKYATYEDFVEDLADWKAEQRWAQQQRQQLQQTQAQELGAKVADARTRYGQKFDEVLNPTLTAIVGDQTVSPAVKAMLNDSEVLPDLIFTIGSDPKELAAFVQMAKTNPGKALRYIALTESLIHEELDSKATKPKGEVKTELEPAPAKPQTAAPKPPAEVGGRAATPADDLESAAQAGDFRKFKAESNRRALSRLRG